MSAIGSYKLLIGGLSLYDYFCITLSLQSFRRRNGCLLTQMPLPDTIIDFWHLVYDQESPVIIMLDEAQSQVHLTESFYGVIVGVKLGGQ